MANPHKHFVLKLNKNKFPHEIHRFLYNNSSNLGEKKRIQSKRQLKSWYLETFQKNNRWNKTLLISFIKNYSDLELDKLIKCFSMLFNTNSQYHQVFIRYLREYQEERNIVKSTLGTYKLKVEQTTFEEIIHYFGELKRTGKVTNSNKQIARILKLVFNPDKTLEEISITDRLKNKKGYK